MTEISEKKYDISEKIRDRQESLVERLDGKADRLLTVLTIASGIVGFLGPIVFEKLKNAPLILIFSFSALLITFFLFSIPMMFYVLRVVGPHAKPVQENPEEWDSSVSFYGGILKVRPAEYEEKMNKITMNEMFSENVRQSYILAGIIDYKITNLKKAMKWLPAVFGLLIGIIVIGFIIYWRF